jgi:hypothetical protein
LSSIQLPDDFEIKEDEEEFKDENTRKLKGMSIKITKN